MFSLLINNDVDFKTKVDNVAYLVYVEFFDRSSINVYIPGGSLAVDKMLEDWINYVGTLDGFIKHYRDARGVYLDTRISLDESHATYAYVRVIEGPIHIHGYTATTYLKPKIYRN
jgi:hypothetical protein